MMVVSTCCDFYVVGWPNKSPSQNVDWVSYRAGQASALAAGMRDFTDHILASLRSKAPGATVTEQDVRSMLSDFRRRAA